MRESERFKNQKRATAEIIIISKKTHGVLEYKEQGRRRHPLSIGEVPETPESKYVRKNPFGP